MNAAIKRRPVLWALAFFAGGILAALFSGSLAAFAMAFLVFGGAACLMMFFSRRAFVLIYMAFFGLGALLASRSAAPRYPAAEALADSGETLTMSGTVLDVSVTGGGFQAIHFKCLEAGGLRTGFVVAAVLPGGETAQTGQTLTLSGKLSRLERPRNPGEFDEFWYYKARKVDYTAYPRVLAKGPVRRGPSAALNTLRDRLARVYDGIFPPEQAGLVKSIVLGDKSGLDGYTKELYRAAGIYHILQVSGLHISIISAAVYFLLKRLVGPKPRGLLTLALLTAYTCVTGASVPAVRALVMAAVVIAGRLLHRERDTLSSVAFACLCLLIYEPLYLMDAGFQLSFSAVFGVSALARPLERAFGKGGLGKAKSAAGSSAAACLGMLPLTCWHFYAFQTYSIVVNMIILPTTSLLVIAAVIAGFAGLFSAPAAAFAAGSVYYLLKFYDFVCGFFNSLPFASLLTGRPGPALCVSACLCVLALAAWLSPRRPSGTGRRVFLCLLAVSAALFVYGRLGGGFRVTEPASRADGCPVALLGNTSALFDAGLSLNAPTAYLDFLGIGTVDAVFLSRADGVSAAMVTALAGQKRIRNVFVPPGGSGAYPAGTTVTEMRGGDAVTIGGIEVRALGPGDGGPLAFLASADGASFLFAEGLDWDSENVIEYIGGLSADVLFLPAKGDVQELLADALSPRVAVAGASAAGKSLVSEQTAENLASRGIPLYDAARRGAVTVSAGGGGIFGRRLTVSAMLYR